MGKIAEVQEVTLTKLIPYVNNAKIHSDEQVTKIASSIREFGFLNPVLIDKEFNIIAGHGRVMAAKKLELETVPCLFIEGLTDSQRKAYILADNKLGELAEWDMELVSQELEALKENGFEIELTGFTFDDITNEDIDFSQLDEDAEEIQEETPADCDIQRGTIFQLGRHRLMCGDSTSADDVELLMNGDLADLVVTDPPYNVALGHHMRPSEAKQLHRRTDGLVIDNDDFENEEDFISFLSAAFINMRNATKMGGVFYIWHGSTHTDSFKRALEENGLQIRELLVWVKNIFAFGRQDYQWRHELCWYGWKEGAAHYFIDDRTKSTVFEKLPNIDEMTLEETRSLLKKFYRETETMTSVLHENKPLASELHPTMKPVALIERQIHNSSREDEIVLDLFGGSGTTLISCENQRRRCRMMEYDPHYCDVIIKRWEKLTGQRATIVQTP